MKPVLLLAVLLFLWCHTTIASTTVPYPRRSLAGRALHVAIDPNTTPKSVPFDNSLQIGSPDIASDDPRIVKEQPGCEAPEQVIHGGYEAVLLVHALGSTASFLEPGNGQTYMNLRCSVVYECAAWASLLMQ